MLDERGIDMKRRQGKAQDLQAQGYSGAVLCRDISVQSDSGRVSIRRGTPLSEALEKIPYELSATEVHFLVPDEDDITQEAASEQIAQRIVGTGLQSTEPHQGQVDLRAATAGVLRIDPDAVRKLNQTQLALIATSLDGRVVEPDETVAIVKASELLMSKGALDEALSTAGDAKVIEVRPFVRRKVALLAGDRIREANLNVSSKHLGAGLERFGAELTSVQKIPDDPAGIAETYQQLIDSGIELILVAGSIVLDPEDPYLTALDRIGATLVRRGAPIDPGTMFWVARKGDITFFGLASCEMYGKLSIIDLFLPYALAGEDIDNDLISRLGYGGLLNDTHIARRPVSWR
jgi:hypothetical protein